MSVVSMRRTDRPVSSSAELRITARMRSVIRNAVEDDAGHSVRRMLTTLMRVSPRRRA